MSEIVCSAICEGVAIEAVLTPDAEGLHISLAA